MIGRPVARQLGGTWQNKPRLREMSGALYHSALLRNNTINDYCGHPSNPERK